jgi:metal-sulfur cluster biosynthetic enzyme
MPTKREVLDSLRKVIDPEIGLNIVDLGLVYRVEVSEQTGSLDIDFTLTSPGCPLADVIENDMLNVLKEDHGLDAINTNLVWNPPWNLDFMSEEARLELGYPI